MSTKQNNRKSLGVLGVCGLLAGVVVLFGVFTPDALAEEIQKSKEGFAGLFAGFYGILQSCAYWIVGIGLVGWGAICFIQQNPKRFVVTALFAVAALIAINGTLENMVQKSSTQITADQPAATPTTDGQGKKNTAKKPAAPTVRRSGQRGGR